MTKNIGNIEKTVSCAWKGFSVWDAGNGTVEEKSVYDKRDYSWFLY